MAAAEDAGKFEFDPSGQHDQEDFEDSPPSKTVSILLTMANVTLTEYLLLLALSTILSIRRTSLFQQRSYFDVKWSFFANILHFQYI